MNFCNNLSIPLENIFEEIESSETLNRPVLTEVREQVMQVQKLLKSNLLVPVGARKRTFSLSNVLKCGKCGNGAVPVMDIEKYLKSQIWSVARPAIFHVKRKLADGEKYLSQIDIQRDNLIKQERDINSQLDNILDLMIKRGADQRLLDREQVLQNQLQQIKKQLESL